VEAAAHAAGGWPSVGAIAVGLGPGSYTGLRVGISTARALGAGLGIPVLGVGTLDAIGRGLLGSRGNGRNSLAVLDARRGEVFAAEFSPAGERLWGPWVGSPEQLGERVAERDEPSPAAGSGAVRFRDELERGGAEVPVDGDEAHRVAARHICALAVASGGADGPLSPIYLRPPDAERWRERDDPHKTS
jgi:tRNA threonylcarbamoyladenosine biosynthesis protein TsaB